MLHAEWKLNKSAHYMDLIDFIDRILFEEEMRSEFEAETCPDLSMEEMDALWTEEEIEADYRKEMRMYA